MRSLFLAITAMLLASCTTGPSVGSIEEFQGISAMQIDGDVEAKDIKVHNRRALIFTTYWTAVLPDGSVYECSRDLSTDQCKKQRR